MLFKDFIPSLIDLATLDHSVLRLYMLFQDCIPSLIDLATLDQTTEDVQLGALEALTNLALTDTHHQPYTRIIQQLYIYLQSSNPAVRIQTLRLLNNLSTNADMVPHLLAAKVTS